MLRLRHLRDRRRLQQGAHVQQRRRVGGLLEIQVLRRTGDRNTTGVRADGHHLGEQVLHTGTEAIQIRHSVNHHWYTAGHLLRRHLHLPKELAGAEEQVPKDELSRVRRELRRQAGVVPEGGHQ